MSRLLIAIIAVPLVLVLAAAILIPMLLDKEKILELAAQEVKKQTGATLSVSGNVDLTIFPTLGISLGEVSLDMPDEQQPSLQARGLDIAVQVLPLLSKNVAIDGISLDGVVIRMVSAPEPEPLDTSSMSDEELQAFYARRQAAREEAGKASGAESALAVPLALNVQQLSITDSRLEMTELGGETTVIELLRLEGRDLNLEGRAMPLEADIRLPGDTPMEIDLKGSVVVNPQTQIVGLETLDVEIRGAVADTLTLKTSGELDLGRQVADLKLNAEIGETRAEGQLRYASFESPQIDTQLRMNLFNPAIFAIAGPEAAATESGSDSDSAEPDDIPLPLDAIRVMDTRASLSIDQLVFEPHVVHQLEAKLRVADGNAQLSKVSGQVHGGTLAMTAKLNAKQSLARLSTQGGLTGVDFAQALEAAGSEPVLTGRADLNWKLQGKGNSSNALTQSIAGPIELVAHDAVLIDMGIEQMMCEAVALVNQESLSAQFPENSAFEALSIDIMLGEGKASLAPLRAQLGSISLNGTGAMDLSSQQFDTRFAARLSAGLGELDPACRVNDRITAIDWPVNCKGSVTGEPGDWCSVDSGEIIEDLATQEVKRKASKEVEKKFGKEAGDLLKGLLGN